MTQASTTPLPLAGIRVIDVATVIAAPYCAGILGEFGAEVLKVEHPVSGDLGRSATPAVTDPKGRQVGATFLRNNLGKQSIGIDLKSERGRELVLALAGKVDIFAENFSRRSPRPNGPRLRGGFRACTEHRVHVCERLWPGSTVPVLRLASAGFGR